MLKELVNLRLIQGNVAIPDPSSIKPPKGFRGMPQLRAGNWSKGFFADIDKICPSGALKVNRDGELMSMDLGRCLLCGQCAAPRNGGESPVFFTTDPAVASSSREDLILKPEVFTRPQIKGNRELAALFGKSLKLRSVSAGGCGGCELELGACSNVNFDMGRYGFDILASPRHCDGLVLTGPISRNMAEALEQTWSAIPSPKILILAGACAISGGIFAESPQISRDFLKGWDASLYLPGCPFHPLTMIQGMLALLG